MSAASRKKHSSAHKGFGAGGDQLEVDALIAGAGNGRDIEKKGLDLQRSIETSLAASNVTEFEVADDAPPQQANISIVLDEQGQPPKQPESVLTVSGPARTIQPEGKSVPVEETRKSEYVGQDVRAYVIRVGNKIETTLGRMIIAMIELHPERIKGLRTGFSVSQITNTQTRARPAESEASFHLHDQADRPFDRALHAWADRYNDYQLDLEKKMPASRNTKIELDDVTIDVLFIEPDASGKLVNVAWLGTLLYPVSYSGLDSYKVEAGDHHGTQGIRFDLGGKYVRGALVDKQAQDKLDSLSIAPWADQEA